MNRRGLLSLVLVGVCVVSLVAAAPLLDQSGNPAVRTLLGVEGTPTPGAGPPKPTVGAVERPYWRSMSYDRYTGSGWTRTGNATAYDGPLPGPAGDSGEVTLRLRTRSTVQTLPAPWKPVRVGGGVADETRVYDAGLQPAEAFRPGRAFTVTSRVPNWTVADLRAAGTDYPAAIEERYTQLPAETPARVRRLAGNVTADAGTPYATAVAVERWLETNKRYSLDARRPADGFADTFLFEMEAGYCQYFATGMVAMLRAEGVPARYVSGYSPSERTDFGTYTVRGKYAHAWVEVYFPGEGWVTFDPTPAAARASARGSVEADLAGAAGATGQAAAARTPGGSSSVGSRSAARAAGAPAGAIAQSDEEYVRADVDVELDGAVVPGNVVTATVRDPETGERLPDHQVRFNDDPIGVTDRDGEVTGRVPYAESLRVTVHRPAAGTATPDGDGGFGGGDGELATATATPTVTPAGGGGGGGQAGRTREPSTIQDLRYSGRSVTLGGPIDRLSNEVLFTVTVVDGAERFAPGTGGTRTATATAVPAATTTGTSALAVGPRRVRSAGALATTTRRGARARQDDEPIPLNTTIDVTLSPGSVPAPGREVTVSADIEGVPVADATVSVAGETYTTDDRGRATVPAPFRPRANVSVRRDAATGAAVLAVRTDDRRLAFDGEPRPGGNVSVRGSVASVPLAEAAVRVNGRRVATTDERGRATVPVPYAERLNVTLARDRVAVNASRELPTRLRIRPRGLVSPGGNVETHVTLGREPVANASVFVGGERVGRTAADGTLAVDLPVALGTSVGARRGAATGVHRVTLWPWWFAGLALLGAGLTLVASRGLAVADSEFEVDPALLGRPWELLRLLRLGVLLAGLFVLRAVARRVGGPDVDVPDFDEADREPPEVPAPDADENTVYRTWARFADGVDMVDRSPGEVASEATRRGLPAGPVERLREAFEAVRYGDRDPAATEETAREAFREVECASREAASRDDGRDGRAAAGHDGTVSDDDDRGDGR
ncbi:transglutaminase domain-containing protein [Haloglomus litoreum]|uniref:transglutaminase domain-containing protein n=1 Tax=Haloglomus litoreum TaxID=3034026 RepID=UPI0023E876A8|nr:transglutaminase domain-containing protein [Haloglomus sp. DT116]